MPRDRQLEREITPRARYFNRRTLMRGGVVAASAVATGWLYRQLNRVGHDASERPPVRGLVRAEHDRGQGLWVDEPLTSR